MSRTIERFEPVAIAAVTTYAMGVTMSAYLHRGETHKAVEFHPAINQIGKASTWLLSGMEPKEWNLAHLTHHAYADTESFEDHSAYQLLLKKHGYDDMADKAPLALFRDPHSPILESHLKVLFTNGFLYNRALEKIMPFVNELNENNIPREFWPKHIQHVDLTEDKMDKLIYSRKFAGVMGLVAMGSLIMAARGPKTSFKAMGIHIPSILIMAGLLNSRGHTGMAEGFVENTKVMLGMEDAIPDATGSYATDFAEGFEAIVAGEPDHGQHHKNTRNPYISGGQKIRKDPPGLIIRKLTKLKYKGKSLATVKSP